MLKKLLPRSIQREQGFTLIEILATLVILSVIGTVVLGITGKANFLLAKQSNDLDARGSAQAVLDRMVKDIEQAQEIQVPLDPKVSTASQPAGTEIQLMNQDNNGNWIVAEEYGYQNGQIYLKQNGKVVYLIKAISYVAYQPAGDNSSDHVNMDIKINAGNQGVNSFMELSATATCRSINANSTQFVPLIRSVSPNPAVFQTTLAQQQSYKDDEDDEEDGTTGLVTDSNLPIKINGQFTHFSNQSQILLVPQGTSFDPKQFSPSNGQYNNHTLAAGIVYYYNHANGSQSDNVAAISNFLLEFNLTRADVVNNATYDVYVFSPGGSPTGETETVYKSNALQTSWSDSPPPVTGNDDDQPDTQAWDNSSWVIDRGNWNGFGDVDLAQHAIEKKQNCNDKVAFYNHQVTTFDYKAHVSIANGKSGSYALLTLFYNGDNNKNGGWYKGFGVDNSYVYYGAKDDLQKIPGVTISNGQADLEAICDFDSTVNQYRLRLFVNGTQVYQTYDVPSSKSGVNPGYLGVTVTDGNTDATFTIN